MADDVGQMLKSGMSPADIQKAMRPQPKETKSESEESAVTETTIGVEEIARVATQEGRESKVVENVV